MNFHDAKTQCETDGSQLAIPRSGFRFSTTDHLINHRSLPPETSRLRSTFGYIFINELKEAEIQFILGLWPVHTLLSYSRMIWIGIHDANQDNNFVEINGSKLRWDFWRQGEPTNTWDFPDTHDEDAVGMDAWSDGQWVDLSKEHENVFVCTYYIV